MSEVAAHPCKSHFINELGPKSHGKGFRRGQGRMGEGAGLAGVNKGRMTLSQRASLGSQPAGGHFMSGFNKMLKAQILVVREKKAWRGRLSWE